MPDSFSSPPVQHNTDASRFEIPLREDVLAIVEYRQVRRKLVILHTEVPDGYEGKGLASRLTRTILGYAREQQLTVVPYCPYARAFINRHPEYQDLLKSRN